MEIYSWWTLEIMKCSHFSKWKRVFFDESWAKGSYNLIWAYFIQIEVFMTKRRNVLTWLEGKRTFFCPVLKGFFQEGCWQKSLREPPRFGLAKMIARREHFNFLLVGIRQLTQQSEERCVLKLIVFEERQVHWSVLITLWSELASKPAVTACQHITSDITNRTVFGSARPVLIRTDIGHPSGDPDGHIRTAL